MFGENPTIFKKVIVGQNCLFLFRPKKLPCFVVIYGIKVSGCFKLHLLFFLFFPLLFTNKILIHNKMYIVE